VKLFKIKKFKQTIVNMQNAFMGAIQYIYNILLYDPREDTTIARKDAVERDRCAADTALTAVVFKK